MADLQDAFFEFDGSKLRLLFSYPDKEILEIAGVHQIQNSLLIITKEKGIFQFSDGKISSFPINFPAQIFNAKVFSFTAIENRHLAFGTILNGLFITDLNGKIIHHINKKEGLPNNTVLSLFYQNMANFGLVWIMGFHASISTVISLILKVSTMILVLVMQQRFIIICFILEPINDFTPRIGKISIIPKTMIFFKLSKV